MNVWMDQLGIKRLMDQLGINGWMDQLCIKRLMDQLGIKGMMGFSVYQRGKY